MSRIGHKVIHIPAGTTVEVNGNTIVAKGPRVPKLKHLIQDSHTKSMVMN